MSDIKKMLIAQVAEKLDAKLDEKQIMAVLNFASVLSISGKTVEVLFTSVADAFEDHGV